MRLANTSEGNIQVVMETSKTSDGNAEKLINQLLMRKQVTLKL